MPVEIVELRPASNTVFPDASDVLNARMEPLNQNVASWPFPSPIGCSYTFVPSDHLTQSAIVHSFSPATGTNADTLSSKPLNPLPHPILPVAATVPDRLPSFRLPDRSFIRPSTVRFSMS